MKIRKILISGETAFINRYRALFEAMELQLDQLSYLYNDKIFKVDLSNQLQKCQTN